ncbi:AraC family transcriptional regulator [Enterococcus sp. DIV0876]|uniref:AraC family transcriptional regulator n=1 Tax=Enterococcus sp. DIV0876 TaxID=2774633 RepID=UPI003D300212
MIRIDNKHVIHEHRYEEVIDVTAKYKKVNATKDMTLIDYSPPAGFIIDEHFHDWLEFSYIVVGQQKITVQEKCYKMSSGDFIYIPSGLFHKSETTQKSHKISLLIHSSLMSREFPKMSFNQVLIKQGENGHTEEQNMLVSRLITAYLKMAEKFDSIHPLEQLGFKTAFYEFFYHLALLEDKENSGHQGTETKQKKLLAEISDYIRQNYDQNLSLQEVSKHFHVSPQYLSRVFKQGKDKTFMSFLTEIRLNHATYELRNSDKRLIDICYESGFNNNKTFISAFKKKYMMTPSKYRNQNIQK